MRILIPAVLTASLFATNLFAAEPGATPQNLAPGQPAGVRHAQDLTTDSVPWILAGAISLAVILAATTGGNGGSSGAATSTS